MAGTVNRGGGEVSTFGLPEIDSPEKILGPTPGSSLTRNNAINSHSNSHSVLKRTQGGDRKEMQLRNMLSPKAKNGTPPQSAASTEENAIDVETEENAIDVENLINELTTNPKFGEMLDPEDKANLKLLGKSAQDGTISHQNLMETIQNILGKMGQRLGEIVQQKTNANGGKVPADLQKKWGELAKSIAEAQNNTDPRTASHEVMQAWKPLTDKGNALVFQPGRYSPRLSTLPLHPQSTTAAPTLPSSLSPVHASAPSKIDPADFVEYSPTSAGTHSSAPAKTNFDPADFVEHSPASPGTHSSAPSNPSHFAGGGIHEEKIQVTEEPPPPYSPPPLPDSAVPPYPPPPYSAVPPYPPPPYSGHPQTDQAEFDGKLNALNTLHQQAFLADLEGAMKLSLKKTHELLEFLLQYC